MFLSKCLLIENLNKSIFLLSLGFILSTKIFGIEPSVSRSEGVAPLSIHFTAGFEASTPTTKNFHNYDYLWDFGDVECGVWATTGKPKNIAKGPVAAHVYELPGEYTVKLTVKDENGIIEEKVFYITVLDPEEIYRDSNTICVSDNINNNFDGAPEGSIHITTDNLSEIMSYLGPNKRVLLHRGSSWVIQGLTFPSNSGPFTIGAYGEKKNMRENGICENAPVIIVNDGFFCDLNNKQDWRFMDIKLVDDTKSHNTFNGVFNMQRILFLRLEIKGFSYGINWTHYNQTDPPMTIDQMVLMDCKISDSKTINLYGGGERIALLGNTINNADESHVVRIWQAYLGVISNNIISGSSIETETGRHALKLHGPGYSYFDDINQYCTPQAGNTCLENRTEFVVISDNLFGSSGPWPVAIGPTDQYSDQTLSDIIFERNYLCSDLGIQNSFSVSEHLHSWCRSITIRNNIFDGTNSGSSYCAISVNRRGVEPFPQNIGIYNNTIFRPDNASGNERVGIRIDSLAQNVIVKNNLISFLNSQIPTFGILNESVDLISSNNLENEVNSMVDPENIDPLNRNYMLLQNSPAIDQGTFLPVYDDYTGESRKDNHIDIGAYEYYIPTTIFDDYKDAEFKSIVFPNPAKEILNVDVPDFKRAELFNFKGILKLSTDKKELNIKRYTSGLYFLRVYNSQNEVFTFKIIKE